MAKDLNILHSSNYHLLGKIQDLIHHQSMDVRAKLNSLFMCTKTLLPQGDGFVEIARRNDVIHFHGVAHCHNAFGCPICARKMLLQHKQKIRGIIRGAIAEGKAIIMLTETVPHLKCDTAEQVLNKLKAAHSYRRKRSWLRKELREKYNSSGFVSSLECTYGDNGYHFHYHNLLIMDADKAQAWYENMFPRLKKLYIQDYFKYCEANNIITEAYEAKHMDKYSFFVRTDDNNQLILERDASAYIAGWGIDSEISGSNNTGHATGRSLFELADGTPEEQNIFLAYILSTVHSTQRISYSPGIQKHYRQYIEECKQEAESFKKKSLFPDESVCYIPLLTWREIIELEYSSKHSIRGYIIEKAYISASAVLEYIQELPIEHPLVYRHKPYFGTMEYDHYIDIESA